MTVWFTAPRTLKIFTIPGRRSFWLSATGRRGLNNEGARNFKPVSSSLNAFCVIEGAIRTQRYGNIFAGNNICLAKNCDRNFRIFHPPFSYEKETERERERELLEREKDKTIKREKRKNKKYYASYVTRALMALLT